MWPKTLRGSFEDDAMSIPNEMLTTSARLHKAQGFRFVLKTMKSVSRAKQGQGSKAKAARLRFKAIVQIVQTKWNAAQPGEETRLVGPRVASFQAYANLQMHEKQHRLVSKMTAKSN